MQVDDAVGAGGKVGVVGGNQCRTTSVPQACSHEGEDGQGCLAIEIPGGLIGQDKLGIIGQGPADSDTLLFTAGQGGRSVMVTVSETGCVQEATGVLAGPAVGPSQGQLGQDHVLKSGEFSQEVVELEHHADPLLADPGLDGITGGMTRRSPDPDGAGIGLFEEAGDVQKAGFASP